MQMVSRLALPDPRMSSVVGNVCVLLAMGGEYGVFFFPQKDKSFDKVMGNKGLCYLLEQEMWTRCE